jgi:hypothetical protein
MQAVMNLELLPNEIFIECFEYLNAPNIFYSFDQLNYRFSKLIRTIPLHLGCEHVRKSIFDQFCRKMLSTPEIKTQIRSLHLSNDNTCVSIKRFLSLFSLNEFSHLRSFTLTEVKSKNVEQLQLVLPLLSELNCFCLMDRATEVKILLSVVQISQLRTLSVDTLSSILTSSDAISLIKNLTISYCSPEEFYQLFRRLPMLQYLNIQNLHKSYR